MIKFWDYLREYNQQRDDIIGCVERVFSSGRLILGSHVEAFERNFSSFCGVSCGVGVNSGTDALFLSLRALDIEPGDEVITVPNTAVPTVAAIRAAGARPVFVDVEDGTFLMDVSAIEAALTGKTRCIVPVHLFGQAVDMDCLGEIAKTKNIRILEDCAQAAGASYKGQKVGSFGDVAAFSFYPTKILGAFGDAGMIVTDRRDLGDRARRLRFYGMEHEYYSEEEGYNSRLDEVQASILDHKLGRLGFAVSQRQTVAAFYTRELSSVGDIVTPAVGRDRDHAFYAYTIRTGYRDRLREYLAGREIETRINYPVPIHLMRGYSFLGYRCGDFPVSERLAGEILCLPLFPGITIEECTTVVEAIRSFFRDI